MIVYDLQNVAHEMQSVDARECVNEMGWSYKPQEEKKPEITRDEMKTFLTEKGIEFANNIKGDALLALYEEAQEKAE